MDQHLSCEACGRVVSKVEVVQIFEAPCPKEPRLRQVGRECYRKIRASDRENDGNLTYNGWRSKLGELLTCLGSDG